jgi:hypothetical protein
VLARNKCRDTVKKEVLKAWSQLSDHRCLNAATMPEAASARRSGAILVAGLKQRILRLAGVEVTHVVNAPARDSVRGCRWRDRRAGR